MNKNKNGVTKGPSSHEQPSDVSGIHQQNDYASLKRRPQRRSKRIRQETRVCWPNSRKNPKFTTELFEQNALSEFRLGSPNGKNHIKQLVSLTRYLTSSHSLTLKESTHFLYKKKGETWIFSENNTFAGDVFTLDRAAGNSLIFCNKLAKNEDVCCLARPVQFLVSIFLSGFFFLQGDQWLTPIGIDVVNVGVSSSSCFFILTPWGQEQTKLKVIDRFQKTFYPKICMRF